MRSSSSKSDSASIKPSPFEAERKAAQRAAINALKRARRAAEKAGVDLSEWEGEFLGSVGERVATHGRAFGDPEKGAPGQALSRMQAIKLKEITAKAKGETPRRGQFKPKV
jgi:pyruvate/2-oxoglutarate dehydrogenase complex dihydrolipoamide acyltransferase (E2) component